MSTIHHARAAYGRHDAPMRSPRSIEYDLFARITKRLSQTWQARDTAFAPFAQALSDNLRLWTTLAADVAQEGNTLPRPLRAQLFYLCQFTIEHSRGLLDNRGTVEVLIDINTAVMRGLRGNTGVT